MKSLPFFSNSYPNKITKFYQKLNFIVQVLDKMNKLRDIKVYEMLTLDKLPKIMGDFLRLDHEWQEFLNLAEPLRNRTNRNLKTLHNSEKHEKYKRENIFQRKGRKFKDRQPKPKTSVCKIVSSIEWSGPGR